MERRNFLKLPLALGGAVLATQAVGLQSATPAQAAIPTGLKGFGYGGQTWTAMKRVRQLNVDWYYGWCAKYPTTPGNFIPMIRDREYLDKELISIKAQLPETRAKELLGFNEPDLAGQADMSVDEAIRLWPKLESTGLRLGSPATISPNAPWMEEFMTKAKRAGLRIDFVTMHCYGWPRADSFLEKIDRLHDRWQLPVWVTEYAVADFKATATVPNRYPRSQVNDFMRATVAGMREREYVERFAWKTRKKSDIVMGSSAIFQDDGALTSTGKLYASL